MLITTPQELKSTLARIGDASTPAGELYFDRILMVTPDHYDIQYAINPYMQTPDGKLKSVDRLKAKTQWEGLKSCFEKLGYGVSTLTSTPELLDMVYAANQIFPFWDTKGNCPRVLCSQMRSPYRQPEVKLFKTWLQNAGYEVCELSDPKLSFEGNGDALIQPRTGIVWGGYGPRTDRAVYDELSGRFGLTIVPLELVTTDFYHLDTCFSILNADTVAFQPEAFSAGDQKKIELGFKNCIPIEYDENIRNFAGNCFSLNGKDIILQKGSPKFMAQLKTFGFNSIEVDTSEFIKGGGSVFCLKMSLFFPRSRGV